MSALASFLHKFCSATDQPVLFLDTDLTVVEANPAFCSAMDLSREQLEGEELFELPDGIWNGAELRELLEEAATQPKGTLATAPFEWELGSGCGQRVCINAYYVQEFSNEDAAEILLAIRHQDPAEQQRRREKEFAKYLSQATAVSTDESILELILEMCLHASGHFNEFTLGHAWLIPERPKAPLEPANLCNFSRESDQHNFQDAFDRLNLRRGDLLPGEVWRSRKPLWVESIAAEAPGAWRDAMQDAGFSAAFGIPLFVEGELRAVMEFLDTETRPKSIESIRFSSQLARRAGRVVGRREILEKLREAVSASSQASLARSQFLSNVSHELRTPMTAVLGMLELSLQEDLPSHVQDYLRTAQTSASSLLSLLNDILDFAGLESGKLSLVHEPFDLRDLLEQGLSRHAERARRKNLKLNFKILEDVPDKLLGDSVRLRQIVDHLLGNAIKFTDEGRIDFHVAVVEQDGSEQVILSFLIYDSGRGFSVDDEAVLYEGFRQVDASSTRLHSGAGLGLAICSALAERMGGHFSIESKEGEGSRAQLIVPFDLSQEPEQELSNGFSDERKQAKSSANSAVTARPLSILLVEDTPANQKVIASILRKRGHHVTLAANGQEALEQYARDRFDAILMDLQMPVMDGYQSTAAIRELERHSGEQTPIIALTAHSARSDREACLQAGMDDYLPKPIDLRQLIRVTEKAAEESATTEPVAEYSESVEAETPSQAVFDYESTMNRLGEDRELFDNFVEVFNEDTPSLLNQLQTGLESNDSQLVHRAAHSLRGLAANFSATIVVDLASQLEKAGKNDDLSDSAPLLPRLEEALESLKAALVNQK